MGPIDTKRCALCGKIQGVPPRFGADGSTMRVRRAQIHEHLQEMGLIIPTLRPAFRLPVSIWATVAGGAVLLGGLDQKACARIGSVLDELAARLAGARS